MHYAYVISDQNTGENICALLDPVEAEDILQCSDAELIVESVPLLKANVLGGGRSEFFVADASAERSDTHE